jgi:hypothetical protein
MQVFYVETMDCSWQMSTATAKALAQEMALLKGTCVTDLGFQPSAEY